MRIRHECHGAASAIEAADSVSVYLSASDCSKVGIWRPRAFDLPLFQEYKGLTAVVLPLES